MSESLYPPGYCDPEWDGAEDGFREIVLPARIEAIVKQLNRRYPLPDGLRIERETVMLAGLPDDPR